MITPNPDKRCDYWSDHEWSEPEFIENGKHPTMGRFNRYRVTCERCGKTTLQTDWIDIPVGRMA